MEGKKQTSILTHMSSVKSDVTSNLTPHQMEKKGPHKSMRKSGTKDLSGSDRKSLKTIQATTEEGSLTRGGTPVFGKSKSGLKPQRIHTCEKSFDIYKDPGQPASSKTDESTQTDTQKCWCKCHSDEAIEKLGLTPQEAEDLLCGPEAPPEYWKQLAEERREALAEALEENEELHTSINELKEENRRLSEAGEKLAKYVLKVTGEGNESDNESNKSEVIKNSGETMKETDD